MKTCGLMIGTNDGRRTGLNELLAEIACRSTLRSHLNTLLTATLIIFDQFAVRHRRELPAVADHFHTLNLKAKVEQWGD
jgi:hypothetical protein